MPPFSRIGAIRPHNAGSSIAFDPENRLTRYASVQTNGYNGDGLRAWKQTSSGRTYYIYDGDEVVGEFASGTNYLSALNTWGANGLLARHTRAGSWYYTFDMQGNVAQKLNSAGAVLSSFIFDPAGNGATNDTNPDPYSGFGWQWGYVSDYETGLTLLGHRFYDNSTQRFLTRDPIGYDGGINLYAYVGNNPVNWVDPSGRFRRFPSGTLPGILEDVGTGVETAIGTIAIGTGLFFGSAGPADPVNEWGPGKSPAEQDKQKNDEYLEAKNFCDAPVEPGSNRCSTLSRQIDHAEECIAMYEAWDAKWFPGRHETKMIEWKKRLKNLKDEHKRSCCN